MSPSPIWARSVKKKKTARMDSACWAPTDLQGSTEVCFGGKANE